MASETDFYRSILDNLHDGVYFVDDRRRITYWNHGAERISGYGSEDVVGHLCADNILVHIDNEGVSLCKAGCPVAQTLKDGEFREADVYLHHADGHRVPVSVRVAPIYDQDKNIIGAVETFSSNAEKISALDKAREFEKLSLLDPLTQIGNRRFAEIELQRGMDEFKRSGIELGVLIVDIDYFKTINDTYGHEIGDKVLMMFAKTLAQNLRAFEFVGRWGGEEFIIITQNLNLGLLGAVAERLRILIENSWVLISENKVQVTASFGGTILKTGDTTSTLISRADKYLYQSKGSGRNTITIKG